MPTSAARWWDSLPENFWQEPDHTPLDQLHPLKVYTTATLDHVGRLALGAMLSTGIVPALLSRRRARRDQQRLEFYGPYADAADPDRVFLPPPDDVLIRERKARWYEYRPPAQIECRQLRFETPYQPLNPMLGADWARQGRNRIARAQYWTHANGPRPTLIFTHGFFADAYWLNSLMFSLLRMYAAGYDIVLYTLPFHGARSGAVHPFSGYGFMAGGIAGINESMLQAVCELRVLIGNLYRRGVPAVGLSGLSLGGYLTALMACVEDRLAFCIPNSPVVVPIDLGLDWLTVRHSLRAVMRRQKLNLRDLRRVMALHCPLTYPARIDTDRIMIIGGAGDRFTPPHYTRLLHEHWPGSDLHWFPGNHMIHLQRRFYLRRMREFMDRNVRSYVQRRGVVPSKRKPA